MTTRRVRTSVTDSDGNVTTWEGAMVTQHAPTISGAIVPQSSQGEAPRTITLTASDVDGGALTYTCEVETAENSNVYAPATATGQPNVFTVVG